ncbi:hypothetical protein BN1723_017047, partial [Verticillium longisporum]
QRCRCRAAGTREARLPRRGRGLDLGHARSRVCAPRAQRSRRLRRMRLHVLDRHHVGALPRRQHAQAAEDGEQGAGRQGEAVARCAAADQGAV